MPSKTKWIAWFRPLNRGWRQGDITLVPIEIDPGTRQRFASYSQSLTKSVVVSVPASCGNAVRRNRFRRLAKNYFRNLLVTAYSNEAKERALWIRLSNRHRLDKKILLSAWQESFDSLAPKVL